MTDESAQPSHAPIVEPPKETEQKPKVERPLLIKLKTALAKAQLEIFNPTKNRAVSIESSRTGQNFGYEYAELCAVIEIIRKPLATNGLTFTQSPKSTPNGFLVVTTLQHESGEEKDFYYPLMTLAHLTPEKAFAGGFTYAKRQALKGIFGIADDTEDKDANDGVPGAQITDKAKAGQPSNKNQNQKKDSHLKPVPTAKDVAVDKGKAAQSALADDRDRMEREEIERKKNEVPKSNVVKKNDNPGDFVITFGTDTKGKKVSELSEKVLKNIYAYTQAELKKTPPVSNLGDLLNASLNVKAFLNQMEVEV